ncbi:cell division protein PerM [Gephyromycinifex aptenodytis]|uniref:cell division protein PerM n=1 Tax=Gephyromycinifex aptenodytis TaxID=2716227 RepID=UPI001447945E|nr:DUF6350 family protein [Gephyromycinifex aptenodytis]
MRDLRPDLRPSQFRDLAASLPPWTHAIGAAVGAAAASATIIVAVVFFVWLAGASGSASAGEALSAGIGAWLLAHGASLSLGQGRADLTPWLLTLLPFFAARWSAGRLVPQDSLGAARWDRLGGLRRDVGAHGIAFVAAYVVTACVLAFLARLGGVSVSLLGTLFGSALLALLAYLFALLSQHPLQAWLPEGVRLFRRRVPFWAQAALRPAVWGALGALAAGLLLVLLMLGLNAGRVLMLYRALQAGVIGDVGVTLGQLAYLPTFAVWALAWMAGPGFGIGAGSTVSWSLSQPGLLPLVPVFGALPDPGPLPTWNVAAVLVPISIGAGIGAMASRRLRRLHAAPTTLSQRAAAAAAAATLAAGLLTVAAAAASGPLGAARLAHVGVAVPAVGAALLGELLLGAALAALLGGVRLRRKEGSREGAAPVGSARPSKLRRRGEQSD